MTTAVECKLIREGGTRAEAGGTEYHFQPYTDGAHVAVIDNDDHADVFLGIREAYRLYRGDGQPVDGAKAAAPSKVETKEYSDGSSATGTAQLPDQSPEQQDEADDLASLRAEYEALYGKKAHHNTGIEKLRELIAAKK